MKGKILAPADRVLIRTMIVSVFVASALALGPSAQASFRPTSAQATHRSALVTTIKVTASSFKFTLSKKTAGRGIVIFKVTNTASIQHDFSIKGRTTRKLSHGQTATLRVTFLRKGHYPYKCTVDSHASLGMKGVFTIT
jgi:plastocyanin